MMKSPRRSLKKLVLTAGCPLLAALGFLPSAFAQTPVFEARFNDAAGMELQNGATLEMGVSRRPEDRSYSGDISKMTDGQKGPLASASTNNPAAPLEEFTITVWYKPRQAPLNDATLFGLLGTVLIWEEKTNQWVLRIDTKPTGDPKPSGYWFRPGNTPPSGSWASPGVWTFLAVTWKRAEKKVIFYQGGDSSAIQLVKETIRSEEVEPLVEKPGSVRVVGNAGGKSVNRPFDGNVDNVRFYSSALTDAMIEKIRQADLNNKAPNLP